MQQTVLEMAFNHNNLSMVNVRSKTLIANFNFLLRKKCNTPIHHSPLTVMPPDIFGLSEGRKQGGWLANFHVP